MRLRVRVCVMFHTHTCWLAVKQSRGGVWMFARHSRLTNLLFVFVFQTLHLIVRSKRAQLFSWPVLSARQSHSSMASVKPSTRQTSLSNSVTSASTTIASAELMKPLQSLTFQVPLQVTLVFTIVMLLQVRETPVWCAPCTWKLDVSTPYVFPSASLHLSICLLNDALSHFSQRNKISFPRCLFPAWISICTTVVVLSWLTPQNGHHAFYIRSSWQLASFLKPSKTTAQCIYFSRNRESNHLSLVYEGRGKVRYHWVWVSHPSQLMCSKVTHVLN